MPRDERIIRPRDAEVNGEQVIFRCIAIAALLVVAFHATSCRDTRASKLYAQATEHAERGEFESAVRVYEDLMTRFPESPEAEHAREEVPLYRGLDTAVDFYGARKIYDLMILSARAIYRFEDRRKRWPASLDQLTQGFLDEPPVDPWGRELRYAAKPARRGYVLGCYGSDGERGGNGEARDWFIEDGRFVDAPSIGLP